MGSLNLPTWTWVALLAAAFGSSALLTGWYRRYALGKRILDYPNERSSHTIATPRGGGLAIVVVSLTGLLGASAAGWISPRAGGVLAAAGLLVAIVGSWDDRWGLAARWRFLAHVCASILVVAALPPLPPLLLGHTQLQLGAAAFALAVFLLAAFININNFMDGIDAIAATEAIFVFVACALICGGGLRVVPAIAAAACGGFLLWNWPPAKIFLGDIGSGFLGLMMGAFILWGSSAKPALLWSLAILPGAFVVDGGVTLLRRMASGQKWTQAHRSHAYQHAARKWGHRPIVLIFVLVNVLFIFPLSLLAARYPADGAGFLALAWAPLVVFVIRQGAGVSNPQK